MTALMPPGSFPELQRSRLNAILLASAVSPTSFGARGDGLTDDGPAIVAALATGRDVYLPAGTYLAKSGLVVSQPFQQLVCGSGAIIKPSGSFDAITVTGTFAVCDVNLDCSSQVSGNGVVVTGSSADPTTDYPTNVSVVGSIKNSPGIGLSWKNGPFLKTDVYIAGCANGFVCDGLFDANHGDISAHIVSCTGYGFRTVYYSSVEKRSRSNTLRSVKAFGCGSGGILIETEQNAGCLFAENNTSFEIKLDTAKAGYGNTFAILGANGVTDVTAADPGANKISGIQGGGFNYATETVNVANELKVRSKDYIGSLRTYPTADGTSLITNGDESGVDHVVTRINKDSGSGYRFIDEFDKARWRLGGGSIDRLVTTVITFSLGTVPAAGDVSVVGTLAGASLGGTMIATPVSAAMPSGLLWTAVPSDAGGQVNLKVYNVTASNIVAGDRDFRITYMSHF